MSVVTISAMSNWSRKVNRIPAVFLCLTVVLVADHAFAHGESDESVAEFHLHLDGYSAEIDEFTGEVEAIVEAHAAGEDARTDVDGLIRRWEEVSVHGAIETHAMVAYPAIWQGILGLQQAVLEGQSATAVSEAGEALKAALWQGLGALRLAAARREAGEVHGEGHPDDHDHGEDHEHHHDHDGDHEHHGDHDHQGQADPAG